MEYNNFLQEINSLNTKEEKISFIKKRISSFEMPSDNTLTTDTQMFPCFINETCEFYPANNSGFYGSDILKMDDYEVYLDLINLYGNETKEFKPYLLYQITGFINNYFGDCINNDPARMNFYDKDKIHSLKELKSVGIAMCSERAALAHNILKFIGVNSTYLTGKMGDETHAFITFKPKPDIDFVYDPSNNVTFEANGVLYWYPKISPLSQEELDEFKNGKPYHFNYDWLQKKIEKTMKTQVTINKDDKAYCVVPQIESKIK